MVKTEIDHTKWLVWHGKGGKSVARIKALDASLLARQGYECSTLWWNLRRLCFYIDNNAGTLVNYGARYRNTRDDALFQRPQPVMLIGMPRGGQRRYTAGAVCTPR